MHASPAILCTFLATLSLVAVAAAELADAAPSSSEEYDYPQEESLIASQFTADPYAERDHMEMIRTGELGLAGVRYTPKSFKSTEENNDSYGGDVYGLFCDYDATRNRDDPSSFSTVDHILGASDHCSEHTYSFPLRDVMADIGRYDSATSTRLQMKMLPLGGMIFHEGHSGAGLISNSLAAFPSARVVSEHGALGDALGACDVLKNRYGEEECEEGRRLELVRDVIALLGRVPTAGEGQQAKNLYLRLSNDAAAYLPDLRSLYPSSKWIFVYRDAEHALAKATRRRRSPCSKMRRNPSSALTAKKEQYRIDLEALSHLEVCALHLSTLVDAAVREHDESGTGMLVSYDKNLVANGKANVLDVILPYLGLKEEIYANENGIKERVKEILTLKSNNNGRGGSLELWGGEVIEVSEEVGAATRLFMKESMDAMNQFESSA